MSKLQEKPSALKENIQKFVGLFALLDSPPELESGFGYGSRNTIESGSNPDTDPDLDPQH
jgi:hypothetical protein